MDGDEQEDEQQLVFADAAVDVENEEDLLSTQASSSDDDEEEEDVATMGGEQSTTGAARLNPPITFDRALPAAHSYLGVDLEDVGGGAEWAESGAVLDNVAIFAVPSVVLMPGQTLPLQSLHPRRIAMFRRIIERHSLFVVLTTRPDSIGAFNELTLSEMASVGTLAQILAFKEENDDAMTTIKIRAIGRQRCRLMQLKRTLEGWPTGTVRILPEIAVEDALCSATPLSWHKRRLNSSFLRKRNKYLASFLTPHPAFVYEQNDMTEIKQSLLRELSQWYPKTQLERLADNAVDFSFWVATNLPLDDDSKLFLLGVNCCLQRMRFELQLLRQCKDLCCRMCSTRICLKRSVFSMSVDGPMGAYVNPGGHVHEMLTVSQVQRHAVASIGRPSAESSWFPGYTWTIQQCARCHTHLGWKFKAIKDDLQPKKFWGLTRSSIWPVVRAGEQSDAGVEAPDDGDTTSHFMLDVRFL